MTRISLDEFQSRLDFELDDFQRDAIAAIDDGSSVLVAAPTGSGKTIVAEYAIAVALEEGGKAFYTTPLKALSNQKYRDLAHIFGEERVGLLTGDNAIQPDAPIVVMTTEVLRNMIYAASPALDGLRYVVLDEVHYLQNPYRGAVWEEVIIHLRPEVDLVCLSATVSNAEEVAEWLRTVRGATEAVIEERRPVELRHLYAVGDRSAEHLHLMPTFVGDDGGVPRPNPEAARLDRRVPAMRRARGRRRPALYSPRRAELVDRLDEEDLLPAIYFIFSRAACDDAVLQCLRQGLRLTDSAARRELRRIAERHVRALSDSDLDVLGYDEWLAGFEAGIAAHHAGLVPPMKEAVEEAFAEGLVRAVFATETLSLGINMPARSVVIEKLSKFTGERHEPLTPGEYTQLAGRAGRRGIDDIGYAVVCWSPFVPFEQVASLASKRTFALRSSFRPTYNMAVNLVRRCTPESARHLLNLSFAQFHADRDVVSLERQLARSQEQLERQRAFVAEAPGDVEEYRALQAELDGQRRSMATARGARIEHLRPGDVVRVPWAGPVVVLRQDRGRPAAAKVLAVTSHRKVVRLGADDLRASADGGPTRLGTVELPRPFEPKNPKFIAEVATRLREVDPELPEVGDPAFEDPLELLETRVREHPAASDPALTHRLRAAASVERLEREVARLTRRIVGRGDSLARTFDRVLDLLEAWRYVDGWSLTEAGTMLARMYTEGDLVITEAMRRGALDGLEPAQLAAVASCVAYERRGSDSDGPVPPRRWPDQLVAARSRAVDAIWRDLLGAERDARLPETRQPDPGFTTAIHGWVLGGDLADLLDEDEMTGGDFVRNVKQVVDLLRQVAQAAPNPETKAAAHAAADACLRGVVLASSQVAAP
jgi:ATP-dependent RNA helicase HelY